MRTLQTLNDISSDPNIKIAIGVPLELLEAWGSVSNKVSKKK